MTHCPFGLVFAASTSDAFVLGSRSINFEGYGGRAARVEITGPGSGSSPSSSWRGLGLFSGGMGGRAVGSSFGHSPKDLKSRLRAPHRDWPRVVRVYAREASVQIK